NGAGKTTLFRVLSGEVPPDSGTVRYQGNDITRTPAWARVRSNIGRTFQVARTFKEMTVFANMLVAAEAFERNSAGRHLALSGSLRRKARERARDILAEVGLFEKADVPARGL